jgi:trans-AT polyketide synthase/acyltransferase/oxidoreductase domain-containing protein
LFDQYAIPNIEVCGYWQPTPALVWYVLRGLYRDRNGRVLSGRRVLAKVSRPEAAAALMHPPPPRIVRQLLQAGEISREQADMAGAVPLSGDICVESGAENPAPMAVLPVVMAWKNAIALEHDYAESVHVGLAGGIGTPHAAASAFVLGADFILTGSINQCTVESGVSDVVKDTLQHVEVEDVACTAGAHLEIGERIRVLGKGVLFPGRAEKLYRLYTCYNSLDALPETTRRQLEEQCFHRSLADVWQQVKQRLIDEGNGQLIEKIEPDPRRKMATVFKWYFDYSQQLAMDGNMSNRVDYQIQTGPALGALNRWLKGGPLESWRKRHVDQIARRLMAETTRLMRVPFNAGRASQALSPDVE